MHLIDPLLDQLITKPPLSHDELRDVTELALWAGQLLLQHGAEAARVEETVHRLGTGLGCDWMDILVSPNVIIVTAISGDEFRTRVRRVVNIGVNLSIVSEVSEVSRGVATGRLNRAQVRTALRRIGRLPHRYNRWLVAFMVGLACASFSRLFGGDWAVFGVTFGAASVAQVVRQELVRRYFNTLLVVISTAFVAGIVASSATVFRLSEHPEIALVSSVLLLIPGVPLITAVEDFIGGHVTTGLVRGITAVLILLAMALGMLLAMRIMGVSGL